MERQDLIDFVKIVNNIFGLREQGKELVSFVANTTGCRHACLLFLDIDSNDFSVLSFFPHSRANPFHSLRMGRQDPIIKYLRQTKKLLTRESLLAIHQSGSPRLGRTNTYNMKLLVPMISRNRLTGILVLGDKSSGEYSPEDYNLLQCVTAQAAVGMEKEYLREQLSRRKEELSVINRSSAIMASSLDIQRIFDSFINELRKIADIDWAAINLIGDNDLFLLALSSEIGSAWRVGERMPIKGTATEWLISHKKVVVEPDISQKSHFVTAESHIKQGVRSIAYLPLTTNGRTIGSIIIASRQPDVYNRRQIALLEELTSQIIMPIKNSQLYAEVEAKSRIDGLTGLFNRRSFDETMNSETSRYSRYGGIFSLIIADLDGALRTVNNIYGHLAGDEALRQIGAVVRKAVRTSDRAFRYGGDEFAIFLPNTSVEAAGMVAERIRKQIDSLIIAPNTPVTASLGLASWPANGKEANEIIAAADAALYRAKETGGNQCRCAVTI